MRQHLWMAAQQRRARFFELHARPQVFVMPNPWDVGSAKMLAHAGFEALATTSAGLAWALGVDDGAFWSQMQSKVDFSEDIMNGVVKSIVFGFVVTWIAVFEGYDATPTSDGVSKATTRTVVHSSLAVLGLDFVLTALMFNQ